MKGSPSSSVFLYLSRKETVTNASLYAWREGSWESATFQERYYTKCGNGLEVSCVYCFVAKQRRIKRLKTCWSLQNTQSHAHSSLFVVVHLFSSPAFYILLGLYISQRNRRRPWIVAVASDQRNTVCVSYNIMHTMQISSYTQTFVHTYFCIPINQIGSYKGKSWKSNITVYHGVR